MSEVEQNESVEVRKSGGTRALEITLGRPSVQFPGAHYTIEVRTSRGVENFFKNVGNGKKGPVHLYGNMWVPAHDLSTVDMRNPNGTPRQALEIYDLSREIDQLPFSISQPGLPLKWEGILNLSFLRLSGISEGRGVKFGVKDHPLSHQGILRLRGEIRDVIGDFYSDYLEPLNASVTVVVED